MDFEDNPFTPDSQEYFAYQRAYAFAMEYPSLDHEAICGRVLGYMLKELPWDSGRSKVASEINSCTSDQKLVDLGDFYINYFLRAFRASKGPTPALSEHPSRPSFDDLRDMNGGIISEASRDHRTAKNQALKRDGYRCMLSGKVDTTSKRQLEEKVRTASMALRDAQVAAAKTAADPSNSELQRKAGELAKKSDKLTAAAQRASSILANFPNSQTLCVTNAAHIFSESTNTDLGNDKKKDYASSLWAVMERFGQPGFMDELDGSKIHRLANIMTLDHFLHTQFDRLALWLEADDTQNHTYRICSPYEDIKQGLPSRVTFVSHDATFELPDPRYIKMHAACCRVAHMSGAAGYMDDIMDDLDKGQTKVLSEDGSSRKILEFALLAAGGVEIAA